MHRYPVLTATLLALSLSPYTHAAMPSPPSGMQYVTTVEGISEYRLNNGLRVLLMPDNAKAITTVNMTYLVGSRHESLGQSGYAHLLEHMMYKGSQHFPAIAENIGLRGGRFNGTTNEDRTNYFESIPASDKDLEWLLSMEADRMQLARLTAEDLRTEIPVVINELEIHEANPYQVLVTRIKAVAYDWHGYGHAPIGERKDIERADIAQLQQFYQQYYRPDNAVLLIAGQFDTARTMRWIQQKFGAIPRPATALPTITSVEPVSQGERGVAVRRPAVFSLGMQAYRVPSALHPDFAALKLAGSMLSTDREQRDADQNIVVLPINIGFQMPGYRDSGLAYFFTRTQSTINLAEQSTKVMNMVEGYGKREPGEADLTYFKNRYANGFNRILDNPETLAIRLSEYIALGDWRLFFIEKDRIAAVTMAQLKTVSQHYFQRDNRISGLLFGEAAAKPVDIPPAPALDTVLSQFSHQDAYAPVADFDVSYANLQARSIRTRIGNIDVVMLPKPTRGQRVYVDLRLHWGDEKSLFGKKWAEQMTDALLLNGAGKFGKESLAAERERLHIAGSVRNFSTTREDLKESLELMMLNLKQPTFAQAHNNIQSERMSMDFSRSNPLQKAADAFASHFNLYPTSDVRRMETVQQSISEINALKATDIIDFHKEFYGASDGHLVIIGDFDPAQVIAVLTPELTGWESHAPYHAMPFSVAKRPPLQQRIDTPGQSNANYLARLYLPVGMDHPDYPALTVVNHLLGQAGFESRLLQRLRKKDGLSYHIGSELDPEPDQVLSRWQISATAAPANIGRLQQAIREELTLISEQGFQEQELQHAKARIAQANLQQKNSDAQLTGLWNMLLHQHQDLSWMEKREAAVQALTLTDLNRVARQYLQPGQWSVVITADLKTARLPPEEK